MRIKASKLKLSQIKQKAEFDLDQIFERQENRKALLRNQVNRMVNDRENNFIISRKMHIFQVWRQQAHEHCYKMRRLVHLVNKNFKQHAFDSISIADHIFTKNARHTRIFEKMSHNIMQFKHRNAFDHWRHQMFSIVSQSERILKTA
jgi:hypothetical protein